MAAIDVRQVKPTEPASCFLSDCRKLHFAFTPNFLMHDARRLAGLKFARRLMTCFWDSLLFIYSNAISNVLESSVSTTNSSSSAGDAQDQPVVSLALEGLENAAKLANILGIYHLVGEYSNFIKLINFKLI